MPTFWIDLFVHSLVLVNENLGIRIGVILLSHVVSVPDEWTQFFLICFADGSNFHRHEDHTNPRIVEETRSTKTK